MTLFDIIVMVASSFGLSVEEVRTPTKRRKIIAARRAYGELARRYTPHSSREIAETINTTANAVSRNWRAFAPHMRHPQFVARFAPLDLALAAQFPRAPERGNTRAKPWLKGKRHKPRPKLPSEILRASCGVRNTQIEKAYFNG